MLAGTKPPRSPWKDRNVEDVTARNGLNDGLGRTKAVIISETDQSCKAVCGPEGKGEIKPDLVAVIEPEVRDQMIPTPNQGQNTETNVDKQECVVGLRAKRQHC